MTRLLRDKIRNCFKLRLRLSRGTFAVMLLIFSLFVGRENLEKKPVHRMSYELHFISIIVERGERGRYETSSNETKRKKLLKISNP
jgi:hypothetical protein